MPTIWAVPTHLAKQIDSAGAGPALSVAAQSSGQLLCGLKMIAMFSLYFSSCENEGKILVASGCKSSVVHS